MIRARGRLRLWRGRATRDRDRVVGIVAVGDGKRFIKGGVEWPWERGDMRGGIRG